MATNDSTANRTEANIVGMTSDTALPIVATSVLTRDSRSPRPTRSTVAVGSDSARSTPASRRSASATAPSRPIR